MPKAACSSWWFPHGYLQVRAACGAANFAPGHECLRSQAGPRGRWPGPEESRQDEGAQAMQGVHKATHVASLSAEAEPFPTGKTSIFLRIIVQLKQYNPSCGCIYSCVIYLQKVRGIIYSAVDTGSPTIVFTPSATLTVQAQISRCSCCLFLSLSLFCKCQLVVKHLEISWACLGQVA